MEEKNVQNVLGLPPKKISQGLFKAISKRHPFKLGSGSGFNGTSIREFLQFWIDDTPELKGMYYIGEKPISELKRLGVIQLVNSTKAGKPGNHFYTIVWLG